MNRKGWSYKEDRRLSQLAGSGKILEQIAKAMDRTPNGIRNKSIRRTQYEHMFSALHLDLGHRPTQSACLKRANSGSHSILVATPPGRDVIRAARLAAILLRIAKGLRPA